MEQVIRIGDLALLIKNAVREALDERGYTEGKSAPVVSASEWMEESEVISYLGKSKRTFQRLISGGKIAHSDIRTYTSGKGRRFRRSAIEKLYR